MAYRVYSGPRGAETVPPLEKDSWLYKEFALLDEAMSWARHVNKSERVALLIEGDDGTHLTKREIAGSRGGRAGGAVLPLSGHRAVSRVTRAVVAAADRAYVKGPEARPCPKSHHRCAATALR
jgi:hypothetical protein